MMIVKSLWQGLQEHTVAPEAVVHRLMRRMVEHLQERMACREAQLEAQAEDMRDPVTKRVEMALITYNPKNHRDGSANAARLGETAVGGREGSGGTRGRRAEVAPDGTQTEENPADMTARRMNGGAPNRGSRGRLKPGGQRTGASGTGVHRATERTLALSRPQGSRAGRGSE